MNKAITISLFLYTAFCTTSYAGSFFPKYDINNSELPKTTVMAQCQKSLMHAPKQLESWCEKAYKLGYWQALEYIGLYTGDGSRYISELNRRTESGELDPIFALAWNYSYGRFVSRDLEKSISLFNLYLNDNTQQEKVRLNSVHEELLLIYEELGNTAKSAEHKKYLENNDDIKIKNVMLKKQLEAAGVYLNIND
ncbi:hypothetical protein [Colwellia sp. UCD-KL20]|uniref:hypothetical protein n=1 Tax=Colwellia sp. UCD-KL20 TaxID=1917165 RepID=UPI0009FA890C|nr:hypothetical protein [Colwellia sp. UCD-KL20]